MAAKPKLTPEQWADVRNHWERDPRDGYSWLVDELGLPVSAPGVRKTALRDGSRFDDERRFYRDTVAAARERGWRRADRWQW